MPVSTEQKKMWEGTSVAAQRIDVKLEGKVPEHVTLTGRQRLSAVLWGLGCGDPGQSSRGDNRPTSADLCDLAGRLPSLTLGFLPHQTGGTVPNPHTSRGCRDRQMCVGDGGRPCTGADYKCLQPHG